MQEFHIDSAELKELTEKLAKAPEVLGWARREAMIHAAAEFKALMDTAIGGSGRVKNWQQSYVGSGGGYAAVRPRKKTYAESRGPQTFEEKRKEHPRPRYAVGYITNAINSGHRWPSHRAGQAKGLRGYQTNTNRVGGRGFYEAVQGQAEAVGKEAAEEILEALFNHLEG